jgi:glycine cleavage system transcriptional repressor
MGRYAVTAIGRERPGAVAEVTRLLASRAELHDSSMIMLGEFLTMTLVISGDLRADALHEDLTRRFPDLAVAVADLARIAEDERTSPGRGSTSDPLSYVLTLHGPARPEVVPALTGVLTERGCDITSMITRHTGELFFLVADVELPGHVDVPSLMRQMSDAVDGHRLAFQPADPVVI